MIPCPSRLTACGNSFIMHSGLCTPSISSADTGSAKSMPVRGGSKGTRSLSTIRMGSSASERWHGPFFTKSRHSATRRCTSGLFATARKSSKDSGLASVVLRTRSMIMC